jgi:hypothetical protein
MTTAFAYREIEDSPNVINRNDGEEYAQCECGRMILASYLEDNGQCRECYDEKHTCAYCNTMAERELPKSADGHRYCDTCYRENTGYQINEVKRQIAGLIAYLRTAPKEAREESLRQHQDSGQQASVLNGMLLEQFPHALGMAQRIMKELEAI